MSNFLAGLGAGLQAFGGNAMQYLAQEQARRERDEERKLIEEQRKEAQRLARQQYDQQMGLKRFELGLEALDPMQQQAATMQEQGAAMSRLPRTMSGPFGAVGMGGALAGDALSQMARQSQERIRKGRTVEMADYDGTKRTYLQPYERTAEGRAAMERERMVKGLIGAGFTPQEAEGLADSPDELRKAMLETIRPKPKDLPAPREVVRPDGFVTYVQPPEIKPGQSWDSGIKQRVPPAPQGSNMDIPPVVAARADKLRQQYEANPYVKNAAVIASQLMVMEGANKRPDAAGDLAMIFGYMKVLDPGSVVREGEFANAQNAAGVPDRIRNTYNRALQGTRLNPDQRAQFLTQGRNIAAQNRQLLQQQNERYRAIAQQYGVPSDLIVYDPFETLDTTANADPYAALGQLTAAEQRAKAKAEAAGGDPALIAQELLRRRGGL
jgi:hypothetical protein